MSRFPIIRSSGVGDIAIAQNRYDHSFRIGRRPCDRTALSELGVKVSLHPAQALRTPVERRRGFENGLLSLSTYCCSRELGFLARIYAIRFWCPISRAPAAANALETLRASRMNEETTASGKSCSSRSSRFSNARLWRLLLLPSGFSTQLP